MLIAGPAVVIGWIVYYLRERKLAEEEKNQPKQTSKRLTQSKSEVSNWAQKMAEFKPPKREFESENDDSEDDD
jgi:hypothetical protein